MAPFMAEYVAEPVKLIRAVPVEMFHDATPVVHQRQYVLRQKDNAFKMHVQQVVKTVSSVICPMGA